MTLKKTIFKAKDFHRHRAKQNECQESIISYDHERKWNQANGIQMLRNLILICNRIKQFSLY